MPPSQVKVHNLLHQFPHMHLSSYHHFIHVYFVNIKSVENFIEYCVDHLRHYPSYFLNQCVNNYGLK